MSTETVERLDAVAFTRELVAIHDRDGLPLYLSLEMAKEEGYPCSLLGLLAGAADVKWSKTTLQPFVDLYTKLFPLTDAEQRAYDALVLGAA